MASKPLSTRLKKQVTFWGRLLLTILAIGIFALTYHRYRSQKSQDIESQQLSSQNLIDQAEKALASAEKDPSTKNLEKAATAISKITDPTKKAELEAELEQLKATGNKSQTALLTATEKAVAKAEKTPEEEAISAAQRLIDQITDTKQKSNFQARLDTAKTSGSTSSQTSGNTTTAPSQVLAEETVTYYIYETVLEEEPVEPSQTTEASVSEPTTQASQDEPAE